MDIQVSRTLFSPNDENNPLVVNKKSLHLSPKESMTPVRHQQLGEETVCRGDLSTPRPSKDRRSSPMDPNGEDGDISTPPEPSAPIKDRCKSDPRRKSSEMKNSMGSSKMFEISNAKVLVFEDDRTLVPLKAERRASAGPQRKGNSHGNGGDGNMRTPKKGNMAWMHSDEDNTDKKIPFISGFNVLVSSPDPLSKYHEEPKRGNQADFEITHDNATPQKRPHHPQQQQLHLQDYQTMGTIVKQLHGELDSPPDESRILHRSRRANRDPIHGLVKVVEGNLFSNEVSPDGITSLFNETVSPFKGNYQKIKKMMHGGAVSLAGDLHQESYQVTELRPSTSPQPVRAQPTHHGKPLTPERLHHTPVQVKSSMASTPERKASRGSRPKPFIKKKTTVSHTGNTKLNDEQASKVTQSSPVPPAPTLGKFRKKMAMSLSPLTEANEQSTPSPEQNKLFHITNSANINSPVPISSLRMDDDESAVAQLEASIEMLDELPVRSKSIKTRRSTGDELNIMVELDAELNNDGKPKMKPSRPSLPPSAKSSRPKPALKIDSRNALSGSNLSVLEHSRSEGGLVAEGHSAQKHLHKKVENHVTTANPLHHQVLAPPTHTMRMKFVPMPRRKLHKVEKLKFNPRLEHIFEDEEAQHTVPRWLTILRKRSSDGGHSSRARRVKRDGKNEHEVHNIDNSLLSSTILLINDGVGMEGVIDPSVSESNSTDQEEHYKRQLASHFNPPEGVEQVTDYAGFDCVFNRYGANLKNYVECHSDVNTVLDANGNNLLHAAAYIGWDRAVKFLIRRGIDVNHPNTHGVTPLVYAVEFENFEIRDYLMKKGATAVV